MKKIDEIEKLIKNALNKIDKNYYILETASKSHSKNQNKINEVVRERFFCYEFYHQMRCCDKKIQLLDNNIILSAEINKRSHEVIKSMKIPDFIIHEPGNMDNNLLIMEVKGNVDINGIAKDFNTLSLFLNNYSYEIGIFVLFNHNLSELKDVMKLIIKKKPFKTISNVECFSKIKILCKKSELTTIEEIYLHNLISEIKTQKNIYRNI